MKITVANIRGNLSPEHDPETLHVYVGRWSSNSGSW